MGVIEILLALNKPLLDEIMKNSPIKSPIASSRFLLLSGLSAFVMALALLFYDRVW